MLLRISSVFGKYYLFIIKNIMKFYYKLAVPAGFIEHTQKIFGEKFFLHE